MTMTFGCHLRRREADADLVVHRLDHVDDRQTSGVTSPTGSALHRARDRRIFDFRTAIRPIDLRSTVLTALGGCPGAPVEQARQVAIAHHEIRRVRSVRSGTGR
jgi:hypothetical protein